MIIVHELSGLPVHINPDHIVLYSRSRLAGQNDYITKILLRIDYRVEVTESPEEIDKLITASPWGNTEDYVGEPLVEDEDNGVQADERF